MKFKFTGSQFKDLKVFPGEVDTLDAIAARANELLDQERELNEKTIRVYHRCRTYYGTAEKFECFHDEGKGLWSGSEENPTHTALLWDVEKIDDPK